MTADQFIENLKSNAENKKDTLKFFRGNDGETEALGVEIWNCF